jgi:hypothetical protein
VTQLLAHLKKLEQELATVEAARKALKAKIREVSKMAEIPRRRP